MAMPSRKTLGLLVLVLFLVMFVAAAVWYFAPSLFGGDAGQDGSTSPSSSGGGLLPFFGERESGPDPFGTIGELFDNEQDNTDSSNQENASTERMPRVRQISPGPVIGAFMASSPRHAENLVGYASTTNTDTDVENIIRYIELGTGHVFEGLTTESEITRISNTTIPKINEALFVDQDNMLLRYVDAGGNIKTFSASLVPNFANASEVASKLQGIFLADNLMSMSVTSTGDLSYLARVAGSVGLVQSTPLGEEKKQIFSTPLSEWNIHATSDDSRLLLTTRPSYNTFGVAYTVDVNTGRSLPYIPARKALGVLPTDNYAQALVSMKSNEETKLFVWTKESNQYIDLGLGTFAEKCVWAQNRNRFYCAVPLGLVTAAEPDLWYQGVSQFNDEVWEIDPQTGQSRLVLIPLEFTNDPLDIIDLNISPDEQFLYFRDKTTRSLWSLQLDYDVLDQDTTQAAQETDEVEIDSFDEETPADQNFFE